MPTDALLGYLPDLALAAALAWGAGLRLYLVVLLCGLAGRFGGFPLPEHLAVLQHPMVIGAAAFMALTETLADKIPWLDSLWDALHTLVRIPAGAALAAAVFGGSDAAITTAAAVLGGGLATTAHLAKSGTRALANTSPEPFSNLILSLLEEAVVIAGAWLVARHPIVLLALLALLTLGAVLMLRLLLKGARRLLGVARRPATSG